MTNRIPLIVNAGAAQIQELSTSDNLLMPGTDIVGANTINTSNVIASANITASYFLGNGSLLTGISSGSSYGDANVTTLLASGNVTSNVTTTANVSGNYFIGNGSLLTGLAATYGDANVQTLLNGIITSNIIPAGNGTQTLGNATNPWESLYVSNATIYIASVPLTVDGTVLQVDGANVVTESGAGLVTVTSLDTTDLTSPGNVTLGNLNVTGTVNIPGNITQVNGNSAQFFGDAAGFGALYTGITTGYVVQEDTVIQASADFNEFAQINIQNINSGVDATSDIVATNDIGDNNMYYINMGIASSSFTGASGNSLGTVIDAGDAYIYTLGNTGNAIGGNLVVGAGTAGKLIKLIAGSGSDTNVTVVVDAANTPATSTTTGALTVAGGVGVTGNVFSGNVLTGGIVSATGNIRGGNFNTAGVISATGDITTAGIITAGSGNIGNLTVAGTINAGNINANVSGSITNAINVTGNSQPNITSVGTLTTLSVVGDSVITGNLQVTGDVTYINSNVVAIGDLLFNVANNAANSSQAQGGGLGVGPVGSEYATLTFDNSTTSWNTSIPLSVTGTVSATQFAGNGNTISNIQGANVSGTVATATSATSATTAGTVTTAAQGNITSVGTLTSLSVSGAVTAATLNIAGIENTNGNGVGNIGSSTTYFNTVFAKATSAQYADLAENYIADAKYLPGTVVSFGGPKEVTVSTQDLDVTIAGVVSTDPAYLMNSGLAADYTTPIALMGRVPCRVAGPVTKGAMMVSAGNGYARAEKSPVLGSVIGKALQSFDGEFGTIEIVVGRL